MRPPPLTLAIEIANPTSSGGHGGGGVALGTVIENDPAATLLLASEPLREVDRDRDDLIPAIERLLAHAGAKRTDIGRVAVSVGPGGFTSTRVACATGAMLAEGLGIPAVAVPSALVAIIAAKVPANERVAVLMAAKGQAAWCATIDAFMPTITWADQARAGVMMTVAEVAAAKPTVALADRHLPETIGAALASENVPIRPLTFTAEACLRASALCEPCDAAALVPIYPREPEAVTLWRQRHPNPPPAPPVSPADSRPKP
ncbi:MAG: tRNA (adenosine(37)-N6)-threonylcarbamoyltransferase complex dimerization subunit type 1 TsaB [Phycisphaerales bacterium]